MLLDGIYGTQLILMIMIKNNKIKLYLYYIGLFLFIITIWYKMYKNDSNFNKNICETKKLTIKGRISGFGGHGVYNWIEIDNLPKSINISIMKTKFNNGFLKKYIEYKIGDSIIKVANSNEITIKRGAKYAIYILNCEE